jgi:hypothetical protein
VAGTRQNSDQRSWSAESDSKILTAQNKQKAKERWKRKKGKRKTKNRFREMK